MSSIDNSNEDELWQDFLAIFSSVERRVLLSEALDGYSFVIINLSKNSGS